MCAPHAQCKPLLTFYLDTSVLVAAFTSEAATPRVQRWLGDQEPGELATSSWAITEFSSALALKLRTRQLDARKRAEALAAFTRFLADSLDLVKVEAESFRAAARIIDQAVTAVRAGDALHLAIAAQHGATLVTLDKPFARAAEAHGVTALSP